jgi:hypothetical protein
MKRIIAKYESEVPELKRIGIIGGMGQWATLDIVDSTFPNGIYAFVLSW